VLTESVASAKLLLLTNYRPEYRHEWGQKTYYTQLRLAPLRKDEAEEFLDALLGMSEVVSRNEERWYEAELYRLKGELTLQSSVPRLESSVPPTQHPRPSTQAEAEACFQKAIAIAQKQQAKSLELRGDGPGAAVTESRQEDRSSQGVIRGLQLVH
jgi:hypothetical protein